MRAVLHRDPLTPAESARARATFFMLLQAGAWVLVFVATMSLVPPVAQRYWPGAAQPTIVAARILGSAAPIVFLLWSALRRARRAER